MKSFILSPAADEEVFQIWLYLFRRAGVSTANRIESELEELFEALAATPGIGHKRSDLTHKPLLFFPLYQYMVVYRSLSLLRLSAYSTEGGM